MPQHTQQEIIEYYNSFYAGGDFEYYPPEVTENVLAALCRKARVPAGARVLDLGCGTGFYTSIFHRMGYDVVGIDISEAGIRKATDLHPGVSFAVDDATDLHFPPASFDMIFSLGVSVMNTRDHSDLHTYVRHLMTFLKPGGRLLYLGGSDLSGAHSKTSNWIFHTWSDIKLFIPQGNWTIRGPYLSHFRLLASIPAVALNYSTTLLLRLPFLKIVRKVVYILEKH
jgi:SAM-dependent methyltransferase